MSNSPLVSYTRISPNKNSPRNHKIDTITIHIVVGQLTAVEIANLSHFVNYDGVHGASCNYAIGRDGDIALIVDEGDRSWCSSNAENDHRAITIECASDTTPPYQINNKVYKSLIDLCADICKRNDIKELKWKADKSLIGQVDKQNMTLHMWFKNKDCPGKYLHSHMGDIAEKVNAKLGCSTTKKSTIKPKENYTLHEFRQDVMNILDVDDINKAFKKTPTISAKTNRRHKLVKYIQKYLKNKGYDIGEVDGIAGTKFTSAIKQYQMLNDCFTDGIISAHNKTWKKLLGVK